MRYFDFLIHIKDNTTSVRYTNIAAGSFEEASKIAVERCKTEYPNSQIEGYNCFEKSEEK